MNEFTGRMRGELEEKRGRDAIWEENAFRRGRVRKSRSSGQRRERRNMKAGPGWRRNKSFLKVRTRRVVQKEARKTRNTCIFQAEEEGISRRKSTVSKSKGI